MHIVQMAPNFRNLKLRFYYNANAYAQRHYNEANAEERINLPDNFVNGQKCCQEVIRHDDAEPKRNVCQNPGYAALLKQCDNQPGRPYGKHRANHYEQHHGKDTHQIFHPVAKVDPGDFRNGCAVVPLAGHTGEIVVDTARENCAERNPQKNDRPPKGTLHGTENRPQPSYVQ